MKRIMLLTTCWVVFHAAGAQNFEKKITVQLNERISDIEGEWIAIDSDTLLDVILTGVDQTGNLKMVTYKNEDTTNLTFQNSQLSGFASGNLQLADWNHDNRIDVIISGKTLINTDAIFTFENQGNFSFVKNNTRLLEHSYLFRISDFNSDGSEDILVAGTTSGNQHFFRIYEKTSAGFDLRVDSTGLDVNDITILDFDKNGKNDIALSGLDLSGDPFTAVLWNRGNFDFDFEIMSKPVAGKITSGDFDADGFFDLVACGPDSTGNYSLQTWTNWGNYFTPDSTRSGINASHLFAGDLNSDGLTDLALYGTDSQNRKSNFTLGSTGQLTELDSTGLICQRFGDFDRDGDLDFFQVIDSADVQLLRIFENKTPDINERPGIPVNAFAISAFNKTFIYWEPPMDDHTATPSLTYDVWLGTNQSNLITSNFDLGHKRRMTVTHGNVGTNSSYIIHELTDNRYYYLIQAVDNAYNGSYGVCTGGVLPCFDLEHEEIQACKNDQVVLPSPDLAYWFSTTKGFIGKYDSLKFIGSENDTIFSFVPQGTDCSKNKVWLIQVNDSSVVERETIYACKNKSIKLGIAVGWDSVEWKTEPVITGVDSIQVIITKADSIVVTAKGTGGCSYRKEFIIQLSEPDLQLNGEVFQIMRGSTVQLEAISSASQFLWSPPSGLSSSTIANPVASPSQTTEYTVMVTDSVGCEASAKVLIEVKENAFVPNLFTPNGDGKNDELKIYGLSQARSFQFRIFNREGNVVYETSDVAHASQTGWNGTARGVQQPSGLYYWKIEGDAPDGERLLLNGKKTGSILLVR